MSFKSPFDPTPDQSDSPAKPMASIVTSNLSAYAPTEGLTNFLSVLLTLFALALTASAVTAWFGGETKELGLQVFKLVSFQTVSTEARMASLMVVMELIVIVITFLTAAAVLSVWTYTVLGNARALGSTGLKYSPMWGAISWLLPFVNLIVPYLALQEAYRSSSPTEDADSWRTAPDTIMLPLWWLLWVGGGNLSAFGAKIAELANGDQLANGLAIKAIDTVGDVLITISAILAICVIRSISSRQEQKRIVLSKGELHVPNPEWPKRYVPSNIPVITFTVILAIILPTTTSFIGVYKGLTAMMESGSSSKDSSGTTPFEEDAEAAWDDVRADRYDDALAKFDRLVEKEPQNAKYHYGRGFAHIYKDEWDEAIDDLNTSIELDSSEANAFRERGYARYNRREYGKAISDESQATKMQPEDFTSRYYLAISYQGARKYKQAIEQFIAAERLDAKDADVYLNRGECYIELEQYDKALADYNKAIELKSSDPDAFYSQGLCYMHLHKDAEARKSFEKARAMYVENKDDEWVKNVDKALADLSK